MITEKVKKLSNMIRDGGGSALYAVYTVETVDTVKTIQNVLHYF